MLTKKQFAKAVLYNQMDACNISRDTPLENLINMAFQSTHAGIALDVLGALDDDPEIQRYVSDRAGILYQYVEKVSMPNGESDVHVHFLTMREMLDLLPDELPEKE